MISGAYSNKYKVAQTEHVQRLKEQAKLEGQNIKDRVKELSKETNRRRKALENRKKELEEEEERKRQAVLSERHKEKQEATQKFQKDYQRKKTRPNSGQHQSEEPPQVLEDGVRVVRGHIIAIRNGEQVTVPTLEDALNMVNNPYSDNAVVYHEQATLYNSDVNEQTLLYNGPSQVYNSEVTSQDHTVLYHGPSQLYNNSDSGSGYNYGPDPFDDHVKLRENALQNGGPKFAFMNGEITEGALPQTMGRNSPSASLTSLDSLDEVPSDQLPGQAKPPPGIIVREKVKSAGRRRVTFSDSIEFDDGLTGHLVTAEKESCKQYVKQYNSRMAASNATYSTSTSKPSEPIVKGPHPLAKVIGTPGNTPIKSGEIPGRSPSPSSGSMVVPMSVYSQLNKPVASVSESTYSINTHTDRPLYKPVISVGESTYSTNTYTDHPQQCVADTRLHIAAYSNKRTDENDAIADSLDSLHDSLDGDASQQQSNQPVDHLKQENTSISDDSLSGKRDDDDDHDYHSDNRNIDYYGNPTNIYHNPFGQRNISKDTSEVISVAKQPTPQYGYAPDLLLESAVDYTAGSDRKAQGQANVYPSSVTNGDSQSSTKASTVYTSTPSYYKSWYPGSFFSSKTVFGDETEQQDKVVKKANSVAYDLIDERDNIKPAKQRDPVKTGSNVSKASAKNAGRVNPLGNHKPDHTDDINQTDEQNQVKRRQDCRSARVTARPPHPSTRHKGVVYSSPLHRKRAVAAAKRTTGRNSPRTTTASRRSPTMKSKETKATTEKIQEKNTKNQPKVKRAGSASTKGHSGTTRGHSGTSRENSSQTTRGNSSQTARGNSSSSDEEDALLQNIQRDMDRISMLNNASTAQEEHQKILNTINLVESPSTAENGPSTKTDIRSVYKKVHKPRLGSATQRPQLVPSNRGTPSKIPVYLGPSGNNHNQASNHEDNGGMPSPVNQRWTGALDETSWTDRQNSRQGTHNRTDKELLHPQTVTLRQSIPLDKTPTDDEINVLWDRVRNCLHQKDTQSVGSDSCVNRIDVRRSRTQDSIYMMHQDNTLRNSSLTRSGRAASIAGLGTMRRYGSQEVLRRYGSADNIGPYRQQPLLQQRAQRTHQSVQGKPPVVPRQQYSPMTSRQAPIVTVSTRGGPLPLSQNELRAVMKASQQTQQEIHQTMMNTRTGPSALSIEENKLLQSLDRLNERLKVQEALTANINKRHDQSPSPLSRPTNHQRSSSATYRHMSR